MYDAYSKCELCARGCKTDRASGELGFCRSGSEMMISRAALHMWEEPVISGDGGSGTVFFSGCSLGCVFCQNHEISRGAHGIPKTSDELADIMLDLMMQGAHNINFVTPTHFAPGICDAIIKAREKGLNIPIVYNTGSYDTKETLEMLSGLVDIYLPDLKYYLPKTAVSFSHASDYPSVARDAIAEMVKQVPSAIVENGIMKKGVIVRILLLPAHVAEAKLSLKYIYSTYGDSVYVSLMNQYTPMPDMKPPLDRRVTRAEYLDLIEYADKLGIKNGFMQDFGTAKEAYIPDFNTALSNL